MKINLLLIFLIFQFNSCEKSEGPTKVSGYVYNHKGEKLKNFSFQLISSCGTFCPPDMDLEGKEIITDSNGFYTIEFVSKPKYYYSLGFINDKYGTIIESSLIKNGETQSLNVKFNGLNSQLIVKCKSEKYTGNKMIFSLLNNEIVHFTDSIKRLNSSQIIKFDIPYNQNVNKLKIQLYDSLNLLENSITDFKLKSFRYSDTIFI
jgi:hypothetical protein